MLGKLMKNDYINRGRTILAIYAAVILDSLGIMAIGTLMKKDVFPENIENFMGLTIGIMAMAFAFSIPLIFILSFAEFGRKFFKDQGYLTHTLPVKASQHMLARMIDDVLIIISMVIVYPFCGCIMTKDFSIYSNFYDFVVDALSEDILGSKAEVALMVTLVLTVLLISTIIVQWHFNAAYALGHKHNDNRRVMSVIYYVVLYLVYEFFATIVLGILNVIGVVDVDEEISTIGSINITLSIVLVMQIVSILVLYFLTVRTCDKHLNIE